jgi:hypothetical protein
MRIVFFMLAAGLVVALVAIARQPSQPDKNTYAHIVRFGTNPSRWSPGRIVVVAVDTNGFEGQESVNEADFTCLVGDTIRASKRGVSLTLDISSCVHGGRGVR